MYFPKWNHSSIQLSENDCTKTKKFRTAAVFKRFYKYYIFLENCQKRTNITHERRANCTQATGEWLISSVAS